MNSVVSEFMVNSKTPCVLCELCERQFLPSSSLLPVSVRYRATSIQYLRSFPSRLPLFALPTPHYLDRFVTSIYNSTKAYKVESQLNDTSIKILKKMLALERAVNFAYLFGSQARKKVGPLSDIDIAVYLDNNVDSFPYRLYLAEGIIKAIKKEKVDIVILNNAPPLLCHQIIKNGVLLKDDKKQRLDFEIRILTDYLDTEYLRNTQLSYMKEHIKAGTFFG